MTRFTHQRVPPLPLNIEWPQDGLDPTVQCALRRTVRNCAATLCGPTPPHRAVDGEGYGA